MSINTRVINLCVTLCKTENKRHIKGFLTFLYSSRVMVPSLSVSCMLNRTGKKRKNLVVGLVSKELSIIKIKDDSALINRPEEAVIRGMFMTIQR